MGFPTPLLEEEDISGQDESPGARCRQAPGETATQPVTSRSLLQQLPQFLMVSQYPKAHA